MLAQNSRTTPRDDPQETLDTPLSLLNVRSLVHEMRLTYGDFRDILF